MKKKRLGNLAMMGSLFIREPKNIIGIR